MGRWLLALLAITPVVRGASIRDVDFKSFSYPFQRRRFLPVPDKLKWVPLAKVAHVTLHDGEYEFPCDHPQCQLLTFDQVGFGKIAGLGEAAIATTVFHTGGTANWQYLYVVAMRSGRPRTLAWLEAGSRADMGLRKVSIACGDLLLVVNDPAKRDGDCCSTGSITYRYRWVQAAFHQIGNPLPQTIASRHYLIQTVLMLQNSRGPNSLSSRP